MPRVRKDLLGQTGTTRNQTPQRQSLGLPLPGEELPGCRSDGRAVTGIARLTVTRNSDYGKEVERMKNPRLNLESQFKGVEKALQNPKTPRQLVPSLQRRAKELS